MLDGVRIIEIEGLGPGPFAGLMLADLGADVIVVHRETPPLSQDAGSSLIDRGKRSIVLDLKQEDGLATLRKLAATADGLIEGFRPGVMERLGLGPDALHAQNPRLVYGRITGWGQSGPKASEAGHDLNYIGLSGALHYASMPGTPPFTPPTLVGDIGGGAMYLVAGMLAGLLRAARTGQGTVVDAAIVDGSAHMMNLLMAARSTGIFGLDRGTSILDGAPWSRCYETSDGGWLSVQCIEPQFYAEFLDKLGTAGDPDLAQTPDRAAWPAMAARFAAIVATKDLADWTAVFADSDACVAPVLDPAAAARDPHIAARGTWVEVDSRLQARAAPRFDGERPGDPASPPERGEHTAEILASLDSSQ
ncbi:MAG: CaiB/BaiF CoA-transferase family protein [Woeseiaceae bacterium]|nr:CaiB/BaiF CoA-transferase family protein [Woeseiaceae bacterium]